MPQQFHGIEFGFGVIDATGAPRITVGGAALAIGALTNIDDFGDSYRMDQVAAVLTHSDGTNESFEQMFPGASTVPPGEHREVVCQLKAKDTDVVGTELTCVISIVGVNVTAVPPLPFSGTWGVGITVVAA